MKTRGGFPAPGVLEDADREGRESPSEAGGFATSAGSPGRTSPPRTEPWTVPPKITGPVFVPVLVKEFCSGTENPQIRLSDARVPPETSPSTTPPKTIGPVLLPWMVTLFVVTAATRRSNDAGEYPESLSTLLIAGTRRLSSSFVYRSASTTWK